MEEFAELEAPGWRIGRLTLRDVLTIAGFLLMLLNYQFSIRAQMDTNTEKIAQVDTHLKNTDRLISEEMVPRKEHDASRMQQNARDALVEQQLAALQQDFVQYLMGHK